MQADKDKKKLYRDIIEPLKKAVKALEGVFGKDMTEVKDAHEKITKLEKALEDGNIEEFERLANEE
jgi:hypothetical protein